MNNNNNTNTSRLLQSQQQYINNENAGIPQQSRGTIKTIISSNTVSQNTRNSGGPQQTQVLQPQQRVPFMPIGVNTIHNVVHQHGAVGQKQTRNVQPILQNTQYSHFPTSNGSSIPVIQRQQQPVSQRPVSSLDQYTETRVAQQHPQYISRQNSAPNIFASTSTAPIQYGFQQQQQLLAQQQLLLQQQQQLLQQQLQQRATTITMIEDDEDDYDDESGLENEEDEAMDEFEIPDTIVDIDKNDSYDIRSCHEYSQTIFALLKQEETKHVPAQDYMLRQKDINTNMRGILMDWLNDVSQEYSLREDTLFLAVNYTDRFLAVNMNVERGKLQLVGVTCVLIASKYYETTPPSINDFVYITDNTYTREELLKMESSVLNCLEFNLTVVTIYDFLVRYLKAAGIYHDKPIVCLAMYLAELTITEYKMLRYRPSKIAACAVVLSLFSYGKQHWTPTLRHYTGFEGPELNECMNDILKIQKDTFTQASKFTSAHTKFSQPQYFTVAKIPPVSAVPSITSQRSFVTKK